MNKPKKALGQHWLQDELSLQSMLNGAEIKTGDKVLEVGPGEGSLTALLLQAGAQVTAVEFDKELAKKLRGRLGKPEGLEVIEQDILNFDLSMMGPDYKVVANIPYYLTGRLLRKLADSPTPAKITTLLIQKEVAERVAASPGKMSIVAVIAQFYNTVSLGPIVKSELFTPPPKVDSQIVTLTRKTELPQLDTKKFYRVIKAGFGEKRKKLSNSLAGGLGLEKADAEKLVEKIGLGPNARAQELSVEQWIELYNIVI